MPNPGWMWIPVAVISSSAYAATHATVERATVEQATVEQATIKLAMVEQVQASIFPGALMTRAFVTLTGEQVSAIEKRTGLNVLWKEIRRWKSSDGGSFLVDEVVGKHKFFTIAVALNAGGSVKQIEILDYRESYGSEVHNDAWRSRFIGKTSTAALALTDDIENISGMTLSCRCVTDALRRLLATYDIALRST
jgi:hypothetical protein